jgi:hypothetical protein
LRPKKTSDSKTLVEFAVFDPPYTASASATATATDGATATATATVNGSGSGSGGGSEAGLDYAVVTQPFAIRIIQVRRFYGGLGSFWGVFVPFGGFLVIWGGFLPYFVIFL